MRELEAYQALQCSGMNDTSEENALPCTSDNRTVRGPANIIIIRFIVTITRRGGSPKIED